MVKSTRFDQVRILMTDQGKSQKKWVDLGLQGSLKVVLAGTLNGLPVYRVVLYGTKDRTPLLEYELPTNFDYEPRLAETFSALSIKHGHFLGFLFTNAQDRALWEAELASAAKGMKYTAAQLAKKTQGRWEVPYCARQPGESDLEFEARELQRMLTMAGVELDSKLSVAETEQIIKAVLRDRDSELLDEASMFTARAACFEAGGNRRAGRLGLTHEPANQPKGELERYRKKEEK